MIFSKPDVCQSTTIDRNYTFWNFQVGFSSASSTKGVLFFKLEIIIGINFCFLLYVVGIPNVQINHNNSDTKNIFANASSAPSNCAHSQSCSKLD
ncbi:2004_t:CDS:2, partial [Funneliformis geosporum]